MQNKILHNLAKVSFKRFGCFQMYTFFFRGMSSSQYLLLLNLILSGKHVFKHFSIRSSTPQLLELRRHQLGRVHRRRRADRKSDKKSSNKPTSEVSPLLHEGVRLVAVPHPDPAAAEVKDNPGDHDLVEGHQCDQWPIL